MNSHPLPKPEEETFAPPSQKVWDKIGMTREEIVAAVSRLGRPQLVEKTPRKKTRPICLICGRPIGVRTCQPVRQKYFAQRLGTFAPRTELG